MEVTTTPGTHLHHRTPQAQSCCFGWTKSYIAWPDSIKPHLAFFNKLHHQIPSTQEKGLKYRKKPFLYNNSPYSCFTKLLHIKCTKFMINPKY